MIFLGEVISIKKNYVQWIDVSIGQTQVDKSKWGMSLYHRIHDWTDSENIIKHFRFAGNVDPGVLCVKSILIFQNNEAFAQ